MAKILTTSGYEVRNCTEPSLCNQLTTCAPSKAFAGENGTWPMNCSIRSMSGFCYSIHFVRPHTDWRTDLADFADRRSDATTMIMAPGNSISHRILELWSPEI